MISFRVRYVPGKLALCGVCVSIRNNDVRTSSHANCVLSCVIVDRSIMVTKDRWDVFWWD